MIETVKTFFKELFHEKEKPEEPIENNELTYDELMEMKDYYIRCVEEIVEEEQRCREGSEHK